MFLNQFSIFVGQTTKTLVKYAHAPTVCCPPSTFNKFVDNLTLNQRIKIIEMGFGGLLGISAERIGSRELLKFLFDRLDPNSMVIELGKNRGIHVTPFAVKQVLGIPDSGEDLPLQTTMHPRLCPNSRLCWVLKNPRTFTRAISKRS